MTSPIFVLLYSTEHQATLEVVNYQQLPLLPSVSWFQLLLTSVDIFFYRLVPHLLHFQILFRRHSPPPNTRHVFRRIRNAAS